MVYLCRHTLPTVLVWRSKDNLQEVALLFHHVGSKDQSGCQDWWRVYLSPELAHWPVFYLFSYFIY